jgi:hypothetical protein
MTRTEKIDEMLKKPTEEQLTNIWYDMGWLQERVDSLVKQVKEMKARELILLKVISSYANNGGTGDTLPRKDMMLLFGVEQLILGVDDGLAK